MSNTSASSNSRASSALVGCSLVEWEESEERYRLHTLSRQFADRRVEAEEREEIRRLHAKHYLEILWTADRLYGKGGESILLALRLFDSEWANVQAGFTWAADRALETETAARVCSEYPDAGTFLLVLRQPPKDRVRWREQGLAAARKLKDRQREGYHLNNLGIAYAALGETQRAIELYKQDLAITREIGDRRGEGRALGNLGTAYADLGETQRAIELCEQVQAIAREIGDRWDETQASWHLGLAVEKSGDLARAAELMQVLVDFRREIGHPDAEKDAAYVAALRARLAEQGS